MKTSMVKGKLLPEAHSDFVALKERHAATFTNCRICGERFGEENVFSKNGWIETQISGTCETCWDNLFMEDEESSPEEAPPF